MKILLIILVVIIATRFNESEAFKLLIIFNQTKKLGLKFGRIILNAPHIPVPIRPVPISGFTFMACAFVTFQIVISIACVIILCNSSRTSMLPNVFEWTIWIFWNSDCCSNTNLSMSYSSKRSSERNRQ